MTDNSWYERGELPPVGVECEYKGSSYCWHKCTIAAHVNEAGKTIAIIQGLSCWSYASDAKGFRPLKSDRDKAIEAALAHDCKPYKGMLSRSDFCGKLYDAGLLRLPD